MCGIVGYVGFQNASDLLVHCLEKLEYRGYDSAGVAIHNGQVLKITKEKGRIASLKTQLSKEVSPGFLGIAHTRWEIGRAHV